MFEAENYLLGKQAGGGGTINNQAKTADPSTSSQTVTYDSEYTGLSRVTINPVTSAIDNNIQADNIKKDVTILGVTGTLEQGTTIDDEAVLSYLDDKVDITSELPESYGDGDLVVYPSNSDLQISITKDTFGTNNVNSTLTVYLENTSNKDYVMKYDDNGTNIAFSPVQANDYTNAQMQLSGISVDINNLTAIDVSQNTTDKYKISYQIDENTTSVVFADVLHIDQNYGLLQYWNDCDTLINNGFYDGAGLNLYKLGSSADTPDYIMNSWIAAGERMLVSSSAVNLSEVNDYLGAYFIDSSLMPIPPYENVNDIEVYKFDEQTQDYTIPVELTYKELDNITVVAESGLTSPGIYFNENTKQAYLTMVKTYEYPYYTVDLSLAYKENGTTIDTYTATEFMLDMDVVNALLPDEFTENIDTTSNYSFELTVTEHVY